MFKNISLSTLLQAINVGLPFLTIPWYVDRLGVSVYGKMGTVFAIMQFLQLFVDYGFTLTAARSVSKSKEKLVVSSQLFADITTIKLLIFVLGLVFITLTTYMFDINSNLVYLIFVGYILVLGQAITPTWLFLCWHESNKLLILTIIPKALIIPVIFIIVREEGDVNIAMTLHVIPYLCTGILSVYASVKLKFMKLVWPNSCSMKKEIINSYSLFKSAAATSAATSLSPLMISGIAGSHALGIYLIAEKIKQGIQSILMPISVVAYPRIIEKLSNSQDEAFFIIKKIAIYMLVGVIFTALFVSIFGVDLIILIFGISAIEAVHPLRILMVVTVLTFCNSIVSTYIFIPLGRDKIYSKITIYAAILHLLLIWPLTAYYSYVGASIALLVSESVLIYFMVAYLLSNNTNHDKCNFRSSIFYRIFIDSR